MKRLSAIFLTLSISMLVFSTPAFSKCMSGNGWRDGNNVMYVCVKGDSFADRKKGKAICDSVMKKSCSNPSSFSSSCGSGSCYDANGKKNHSLSGF
jgi:hypothetical protein